MRISWVVAVLLACSPAVADPAPDLVVTWKEGEQSRDSSMTTIRIAVTGSKLHYSRTYSGRNAGWPGTKPVDVDATVKDPKKVAAALAAFDKTKATPAKASSNPTQYRVRGGCVTRGKTERCVSVSGETPDPADLKAIAALRDALLDGVKLPALP